MRCEGEEELGRREVDEACRFSSFLEVGWYVPFLDFPCLILLLSIGVE